MNPALLSNPDLALICLIAGVMTMLSSLSIAARPAAVKTSRVMLALSMAGFLFMLTRFANLLYAPLMAKFVDAAEKSGNLALLTDQIRWVLLASAVGGLLSWALLPTFVELFRHGIYSLEYRRTPIKVALRLFFPRTWKATVSSLQKPGMGVKFFHLEGIPKGFLLANVFATAVWSVGLLAALLVSAQLPKLAQTAVLLSGLVTAFAAIAFSIWVDPQAAVLTDQVVAGERPAKDVDRVAVHLAMGSALGGFLALFLLEPAAWLIRWATRALESDGQGMGDQLWLAVGFNVLFALLASTTYASRISAVRTKRAATAVAVYNLFFLVARLGQQVVAPVLGSMSDFFSKNQLPLVELEKLFRTVLAGATAGTALAWLLMPTLVAVYDTLIVQVDRRGSVYPVLAASLNPKRWLAIFGLFRRPSLFGVTRADFARIPKWLLWANVLVIAIHTVGVVSSVYAGCALPELKRTASLLSSVVNGLATLTLGAIVEPTVYLFTQEALQGKRPSKDIYTLGVSMLVSMLLGTVLAQLLLVPAKDLVALGARIFEALL